MRGNRVFRTTVLSCFLSLAALAPLFGGDSFFGTVTDVRSAEVVVISGGKARYIVRIVGVSAEKDGPLATQARQLVASLVLQKKARFYLEGRNKNREMVSVLMTADPESGFKDVGVELVRAGLARVVPNHSYKYGELAAAEKEAQERGRGIWARPQ
jgi:endonuclease YncB( thermonuclease family)